MSGAAIGLCVCASGSVGRSPLLVEPGGAECPSGNGDPSVCVSKVAKPEKVVAMAKSPKLLPSSSVVPRGGPQNGVSACDSQMAFAGTRARARR